MDTPATKPPGFIGCFPTEKKQNESREAHSAFSLPKGTPSPLKTSVNETGVSLKSSCKDDNDFLLFFGFKKSFFSSSEEVLTRMTTITGRIHGLQVLRERVVDL